MHNRVDVKSVLIGVLGTLLFLSLLGLKRAATEYGDLTVRSLTVKDNGEIKILSPSGNQTVVISGSGLAGGTIVLANALGVPSTSMGANQEGQGGFVAYNQEGKVSAHLGTGPNGQGFVRTFNARESPLTYLGASIQGGGQLTTCNEVGKETVFLGTGSEGIGFLRTAN